jgi:dephospho-CoA kinase
MKLIGITGGIGMGKSKSGEILARRGLPVIDTDVLARQVVEPGQPALAEIQNLFGKEIVGTDGRLRRDELAKKVFSDPAARAALETMLHPRIRQLWQLEAEKWKGEGKSIGFVIIPLLFETNAEPSFTATLCIACTEKSQWERLRARGWPENQIRHRIAAQWPVSKKLDHSDFVIWTETSVEIHEAQLDHLLARHLS